MPCPVSRTVIVAPFCSSPPSWTATRPPLGVNLIALERRFRTTCSSRSGSPTTVPGTRANSVSSRTPLSSAAGRAESTTCPTIAASSTGWRSKRILPARMRETSSMSPTSRASAWASRAMVSSACMVLALSSCPFCSTRTHVRIALSGPRSSCEMVANKSSFARFSASASPRPSCSRASSSSSPSSTRFRCASIQVMSSATPTNAASGTTPPHAATE